MKMVKMFPAKRDQPKAGNVKSYMVKKGFTLLELLLVIAIIASLAGIILMALNPAQRLEEANETKYLANARDLKKAIEAYAIENGGILPTGFSSLGYGYYDICKTTGSDCISVSELIPNYLPNIPEDIENSTSTKSGFRVKYDPDSTSIDVYAGDEYEARLESGETFKERLVGYWKMDEGSWNGTVGEIVDSSGNGNNAKATNATTVTGKYGNAGSYGGGTDKFVDGPQYPFSQNSSRFVSVWFNATDVESNNWRAVLAVREGNLSALLFWSNLGRLDARVCKATDTAGFVSTTFTGEDFGTWNHVVYGYSQSTDKIYFYLNGVLVQEKNMAGAGCDAYTPSAGAGLIIGANSNNAANPSFSGIIDDVRIYNRALNTDEVAALNEYGAPPVAHWRFDEGAGTNAYDSSGNNFTGTIVGAEWVGGKYGTSLNFNGADSVNITSPNFPAITNHITISLWQNGDAALQPQQDTIFQGTDVNNYRVINVHLPWSESNVYWDVGNSGTSSYDRIFKLASVSDFEGAWNYWSFIKNVSTGEMKIYLNGVLWHSGSGYTRTLAPMTSFRIGSYADGSLNYDGLIDDVKIFNYARTSEQILHDMNNH